MQWKLEYFSKRIYNYYNDYIKTYTAYISFFTYLTFIENMTDPIQTSNPQQQWYTDDILAWEDIFAAIPQAKRLEESTSPENIVEDTYKFEPIPETLEQIVPTVVPLTVTIPKKEEQVVPTVQAPIPSIPISPNQVPTVQSPAPVASQVSSSTAIPAPQVQQTPIQKINIPEEVAHVVFQSEPEEPVQLPIEEPEEEISLATKLQTDVQKKFGELFFTTKKIYELKNKTGITEETFDILWANNDKVVISYKFLLDETNDPMIFITKIEQDQETEEETVNELRFTFNEETLSLEVVINDILLFDEIQDFTQDQKKKLQVIDKLNKFTFLTSEELRKIEKEIKEKEEAERERRKLQEIFRNF